MPAAVGGGGRILAPAPEGISQIASVGGGGPEHKPGDDTVVGDGQQ